MRVALLSMLDIAEGGQGLRAELPVGGRSIARHQLGLALSLDCKRIVFLAEKLEAELVSLQHVAEDAGAQFHVIAAPRGLVPLVSPADELFVLSDGLLAMPDVARELLDQAPGVLVLPVEAGLPAGFERLDINHSNAGAMRLPGRLVARLGELPGDWSATSALLRIAVQAGVPLRTLPVALLDEERWALVGSEAEAGAIEATWMRLLTSTGGALTPGKRVANLLVRLGGPAILHAGTRPWVIYLAAALTGVFGLGAAWFGYPAIGFALMGAAWLGGEGAQLLRRIDRASLAEPVGRAGVEAGFGWLVDLAFVFACVWRSELAGAETLPRGTEAFAPLVLFGLLRLVSRVLPRSVWAQWLGDRLLAAVLLVLASVFFPFDVALALMCLIILAAALAATYLLPDSPNPVLTKDR
ncbi:MAG: hypothetical protein KGL48_09625 [Sphingomonadales bacterium]|nr:hypothetical protein [Sphingomonadales bacterium]MDE2570036.1 hypothetical protein [Sphingomonadales bacterium]